VAVGIAITATAALAGGGSGDVSPTPFGTPTPANPDPSANIAAVRGDRMWDWTEQTRSEVLARHGVVATSQPLAAQAGLQVLHEGGNAADAAVAAAAMLGLTEPESAGIGGDMEAIYYSAKDRKLYGLNAAGWAPESHTVAFYHSRGLKSVPFYGPYSVTVPGAVDGWSRLLKRFGRMSLGQVLQPSIEAARQGFGLTERIRGDWKSYDGFYVDMLKKDAESRKVFLRNGHVPALYSNYRNPDLARAYELLATDGPDAFYKGPIGRTIVKRMNKSGAAWKLSDLSSFKSQWVKPISTNYKGYDVFEMPPQTQGFATLEMLNILQECGPKAGIRPARAGSPLAPVLEHPGAGQAAGVRGSRALQRRPAVRERAGQAADLEGVRRLAVRQDQPGARVAGADGHDRRRQGGRLGRSRARRHRLPDGGGQVGEHGVLHLLRVRLLRVVGVDPRLRLPDERPRVVLQPRPVLSVGDRAAQAAVPDDHPGVRDEGRTAAPVVREHGRRRAGPGSGDRDREHGRPGHERPGGG